jgi:hypothetical protein
MKQIRLFVLFVFVAASLAMAQDQGSTASGISNPSVATVNPETQPADVLILAPVAGQTLTSNSVDLSFELVQPAMNGEPRFLIQLDDAAPIRTSSTDYTFHQLLPGSHSIQVTLVDASNSPVQSGSATVQFAIQSVPQATHSNASRKQCSRPTIAGAAPVKPIPSELRNDGDISLPMAGSPLPVLSLIGFGLLIGGAAQAMRKRKN